MTTQNEKEIDPIEEIRKYRETYAKKFNYDLEAIFMDIKEREKKSGRTYVSLEQPPKPQKDIA